MIADKSKEVPRLGRFPLPVEVIPMAQGLVALELHRMGFAVAARLNEQGSVFITDEGNVLLDRSGISIEAPGALARELDSTVGIVEHGLFIGLAHQALIATDDGIVERNR